VSLHKRWEIWTRHKELTHTYTPKVGYSNSNLKDLHNKGFSVVVDTSPVLCANGTVGQESSNDDNGDVGDGDPQGNFFVVAVPVASTMRGKVTTLR
jgi:hypothetical protein